MSLETLASLRDVLLVHSKKNSLIFAASLGDAGEAVQVMVKFCLCGPRKSPIWGGPPMFVEESMYRNVLGLLRRHVTPHLLECADSAVVKIDRLPEPFREVVSEAAPGKDEISVVATKTVQAVSFHTFLQSVPPLRAVLSVLLQLLYSVDCFERLGMYHGDLHPSNVIVETLVEPAVFNYHDAPRSRCSNHVRLTTPYFVRFIDFEKANRFYLSSANRDAYMIISRLHNYLHATPLIAPLSPWLAQVSSLEALQAHLTERTTEVPLKPTRECLETLVEWAWDEKPFVRVEGRAADGYHPIDLYGVIQGLSS